MDDRQRREFHEALLDADNFEDLPGNWQAAIVKAEAARPQLRVVTAAARLSAEDEPSKLGLRLLGLVGQPLEGSDCLVKYGERRLAVLSAKRPIHLTTAGSYPAASAAQRSRHVAQGFVPALITGCISGPGTPRRCDIAVALNGRFRATAPTFELGGTTTQDFSVLVPESAMPRPWQRTGPRASAPASRWESQPAT